MEAAAAHPVIIMIQACPAQIDHRGLEIDLHAAGLTASDLPADIARGMNALSPRHAQPQERLLFSGGPFCPAAGSRAYGLELSPVQRVVFDRGALLHGCPSEQPACASISALLGAGIPLAPAMGAAVAENHGRDREGN